MPDIRVLGFYLGNMLLFLGIALIVPIIFSITIGESVVFIMSLSIVAFILIFSGVLLKKLSVPGTLSLIGAYYVMFLSFLIPALAGSVPIMVYEHDFVNSLFESTSAITTTGLSSLHQEVLTLGVQFFRAYYQWLGGVGIALLVLSFLVSPGTAAYNIYVTHLGKYKIKPLSISTIKIIIKIYSILTFIYVVLYLISGMSLIDSVINAMTTVSTGGFSRIQYFTGNAIYMATILMMISAQPLAVYYLLFRGNLRKILYDPQIKGFIIHVFIGFIMLSISIGRLGLDLLFQVVSALSTTGYSALDNSVLPDSGKFVLSILMIIGAGFGSSGGGIKQLRLAILFKAINARIKKALLPRDAVISIRLGNETVEDEEINYVYLLVMIYIVCLIFSTYIITLYGYSLSDSLFESSSALATTGLSVGISGPDLNMVPKVVLVIDMLLGRIEIIPFIILISDLLGWGRSG